MDAGGVTIKNDMVPLFERVRDTYRFWTHLRPRPSLNRIQLFPCGLPVL